MTITVPSIPTPVPTSTDPTNFDERADALLAALPAVVEAQNSQNVENNTLNGNVNAAALAASNSATATAADRVQTGLDRTAAALSKTGSAADAAATAADRVQTGLDRTAAALSKTGSASDKTATAADRVQTGLDRTAAALSKTGTGTDATATAADRAQTALDRTAAALSKTGSAADAAATSQDRTQTGSDRAAASTSANAAAVEATAAAAEADAAAQSAASIAGGPVASIAGLTGAVSAAAVKTALSISNVTDAALNLKANALQATRSLFSKADPQSVAFTKTAAGTAQLKAGAYIDVNGTLLVLTSATTIVMPSLTAGTDYAIYACTDSTVRADASFSAPSGYTTATSRKIGGFHYAPGGNATAQAGGNTTAQINEYSFWDLKFKPACPDPRGMALVADGFWADIYLLGVDHLTNGTSKYNVTIADGSSPPKIPTKFGGNGSSAYGSLNWWEAAEVLAHHGKRPPSYSEFAALAYGTTEASSGGTDPGATILRAAYTSKWGVMLASGNLYVWGAEFGGGAAGAAWTANTGGRGSTYQMENAAFFGGYWGGSSNSGSRCSYWNYSPTVSDNSIGSHGVCDPLILE